MHPQYATETLAFKCTPMDHSNLAYDKHIIKLLVITYPVTSKLLDNADSSSSGSNVLDRKFLTIFMKQS